MGLTVKFSSKKMAFKKHIPWNKGLKKKELKREKEIKGKLNCKFVRIKDNG